MPWLNENKGLITISVYAVPGSSKSEIAGIYNGSIKIKLKAPPTNGKANKELISFLSKKLNIPKAAVSIVSGSRQKRKVLSLLGCNAKRVRDNIALK